MVRDTIVPSIALDPSTPPRYGEPLRFNVVAGKLHGNEWPMVLVSAFGDDGAPIYGELVGVSDDGIATVGALGGGSSTWVNERPHTAADCIATLFSYDRQGDVVKLAGPIAFRAEG